MVCLGFDPGTASWKARANPLGRPHIKTFYFVDTGRKDEASGNNWIPLDENGNNKRRKLFSCVRLVKELKENNVPSFIHVSELA